MDISSTAINITSVELQNFKGFRRFSMSLHDTNVLVGPNNCGKSTILGAFRALDAGLRRANSRKIDSVHLDDRYILAHRVPEDNFPDIPGERAHRL